MFSFSLIDSLTFIDFKITLIFYTYLNVNLAINIDITFNIDITLKIFFQNLDIEEQTTMIVLMI